MNKVSRSEAKSQGLLKYFTGRPCPHGHVAERFVSTYSCVICTDEHKKRYRKDPEFKARELTYKAAYRDQNRQAINDYAKWYWRNHPNAKAQNAKTKSINKDKIRKYNASYWEANKGVLSKRGRSYAKENLDYFRAKNAERRAKIKSVGGVHTPDDVARIMQMQRNMCAYCKSDISTSYHVDHIKPLALGGSNWPKNLQCLCQRCNNRKSAKDPVDWAQETGRLI